MGTDKPGRANPEQQQCNRVSHAACHVDCVLPVTRNKHPSSTDHNRADTATQRESAERGRWSSTKRTQHNTVPCMHHLPSGNMSRPKSVCSTPRTNKPGLSHSCCCCCKGACTSGATKTRLPTGQALSPPLRVSPCLSKHHITHSCSGPATDRN